MKTQPQQPAHTKGKWKVSTDLAWDDAFIKSDKGEIIAHCKTMKGANKANAQRIVKAVNMHDELIKLAKLTQEMMRKWEDSSQRTFNKHAFIDVDILSEKLLEQAEQK